MKAILTLSLLALSTSSFAQATLEHSYVDESVFVFNLEGQGHKYASVDIPNQDVKIYNADHSLMKTVNMPFPSNATVVYLADVSTKLFDTDADIEMLIQWAMAGSPSPVYTTAIVDENGNMQQKFDNASSPYIFKVNGNWKMRLVSTTGSPGYKHDIYSLPGAMVNVGIPGTGDEASASSMMYPNPMDNAATIQYKLPEGAVSGQINVVNSLGILVQRYNVTSQFNDVTIQRGQLPAGVYSYQVQSQGRTVSSSQFVIQ